MERLSAELLSHIPLLFLLLLLSGFFSGSETALFSLARIERYRPRSRDHRLAFRWVHELLQRPRRLLITLIIGNETANVLLAVLAASLVHDAFSAPGDPALPVSAAAWRVLAAAAIVFPLVLVLGEVVPKTLALRHPRGAARLASIPLYLFSRLVSPLRWLLGAVSGGLVRLAFGKAAGRDPALMEKEFRDLVDLSRQGGALWASEHRFIHNIFDFGETRVSELMTPRTDMVCLQVEQPFEEVLDVVRNHRVSRIPVYEKDKDDIVGVLYAKDLLNRVVGPDPAGGWSLKGCLRNPYFIPQTKKATDLFREFRASRIHMAIVVDEYGGVAGLVTMQDLLEDLFGEILDEHEPEEPRVRRVDDLTVIIPARMDVEEFNERFRALLPEEEYDTMGGLVFDLFGRLPAQGERITYRPFTFTVEKMHGTRIQELRVHRDPEASPDHAEEPPPAASGARPEQRAEGSPAPLPDPED